MQAPVCGCVLVSASLTWSRGVQVRKVIQLGESLLAGKKYYAVTKSISDSNKAIRGKGEQFVEYRAHPGSASVAAGAANANPSLEHVSTALGHLNLQTEEEREGAGADFLAGSDASSFQPRPEDYGSARPDPPPSPFTILFVGSNVVGQAELQLQKERTQIKSAIRGSSECKHLVHFEHNSVASVAEASLCSRQAILV